MRAVRRARGFFALFTALVALGAALALTPGLPVIRVLVWIQVLNGVLLPAVLVCVLVLVNDRRLVGPLANSRRCNVLGWGTFALVTAAVAFLVGTQLLSLLGIDLFGGA